MTFPERDQLQNFESARVWFGERFGVALPLGLREQADSMSWAGFVATYGRNAGPLRLGDWQCADGGRAAARLSPQPRDYRAVIAVGDRISTGTAAASGPVAALTAMLHERGITVEVVKFHQMRSATGSVTFILGSDGAHSEWAMGWADDPAQSALRAVIACANRLFAAR